MSDNPTIVTPESSFGPAATEQSAVPAEARSKLKDRLKKRKVKEAIAQLDDGEQILVIGLRSGQMDEIRSDNEEDEESGDDKPSVTKTQARMFRSMCFDPIDRTPVFDDWTEAEFEDFPLADATVIMKAIGIVNGNTSEPGKDSPSTGADDSSSQ